MSEDWLLQRLLLLVPLWLCLTVHEWAHAWSAYQLGDDTAMRLGRLTLNPLAHVDPIGTFLLPLAGVPFGWARPVPVDESRLGYPRRDMLVVAAAGPLSNLLMSLLWAGCMQAGLELLAKQPQAGSLLVYTGAAGVFINAAVMMVNLLPIPPLDGGRMLMSLLPETIGRRMARIEPWGLPLLLVLILSGLLARLLWPLMVIGMATATWVAGIPVDVLTAALRALLG